MQIFALDVCLIVLHLIAFYLSSYFSSTNISGKGCFSLFFFFCFFSGLQCCCSSLLHEADRFMAVCAFGNRTATQKGHDNFIKRIVVQFYGILSAVISFLEFWYCCWNLLCQAMDLYLILSRLWVFEVFHLLCHLLYIKLFSFLLKISAAINHVQNKYCIS